MLGPTTMNSHWPKKLVWFAGFGLLAKSRMNSLVLSLLPLPRNNLIMNTPSSQHRPDELWIWTPRSATSHSSHPGYWTDTIRFLRLFFSTGRTSVQRTGISRVNAKSWARCFLRYKAARIRLPPSPHSNSLGDHTEKGSWASEESNCYRGSVHLRCCKAWGKSIPYGIGCVFFFLWKSFWKLTDLQNQ